MKLIKFCWGYKCMYSLCEVVKMSQIPALFNEKMLVLFLKYFLLLSTLIPYIAVRVCPLLATVHRCACAWIGGGGGCIHQGLTE